MSQEEIKQRIKYLVEHGGLYDDPLEDVRRGVRLNRILALSALALLAVDVVMQLL